MLDHSDLNTEDFLTLTSYELQVIDHPGIPRAKTEKCRHMCLSSKDPHDPKHIYFNPKDIYIRITLEDCEGKHANSRGYFLDEFI